MMQWDRETWARCNEPTDTGQIPDWFIKSASEWVETTNEAGVLFGWWRVRTPEPNVSCMHVVGAAVYDYNGRR